MDGSKKFLKKFIVLGLVIFALPGFSQQTPFALQEGVVIDPNGNQVFLMTPEGGIEARNLSDGAVIWQTKLAAKPIGFVDGRLYAQAEGDKRSDFVEVMAFTLTENSRPTVFRLALGQEMWTGINHGMGERFEVQVGTESNRPAVWWTSSVKVPQGSALAVPQESFQQASLILDLQTGDVKAETLPPAPVYALTAAPAASRVAQQAGQQFLSNDGRHVMVSQRINNNARLDRYSWELHSVSGAKVGTHRDRFSTANFFVKGSVLVYVSRPFTLRVSDKLTEFKNVVRAVNLDGSSLLWESTLREISYKGPLPP